MNQLTKSPGDSARFVPVSDNLKGLTVGQTLKTRREQLGWSLSEVAAWLRIRLPYLQALEKNNFSELPGRAYALGFLRAYADIMGLNVEAITGHFKREVGDLDSGYKLRFPAPQNERRIPTAAIIFVGILVIAGAYIGWYKLNGRQNIPAKSLPPPALNVERAPAISPQVVSMAPDQTLNQVSKDQNHKEVTGSTSSPQSQATIVPSNGKTIIGVGPQLSISSGNGKENPNSKNISNQGTQQDTTSSSDTSSQNVTATQVKNKTENSSLNIQDEVKVSSVDGVTHSKEVVASESELVIESTAPVWVRVRSNRGNIVFEKIMKPNERWVVPQDGGQYKLSAGNAGGLRLRVRGVLTEPLGRSGEVKQDISLSMKDINVEKQDISQDQNKVSDNSVPPL